MTEQQHHAYQVEDPHHRTGQVIRHMEDLEEKMRQDKFKPGRDVLKYKKNGWDSSSIKSLLDTNTWLVFVSAAGLASPSDLLFPSDYIKFD